MVLPLGYGTAQSRCQFDPGPAEPRLQCRAGKGALLYVQPRHNNRRGIGIKAIAAVAVLTIAALSASSPPAYAAGCIKAAIVGGVAGHYAGNHGLLGAGARCLVGRHYAKKHAEQMMRDR